MAKIPVSIALLLQLFRVLVLVSARSPTARTSETSSNYSYGGGLEAPTDATILEDIPTFSPPIGPTTVPQTSIQLPVPGNINDCGRKTEFVAPLFVEETSRPEWPWVAALFVTLRNNSRYQCVGTILTNRHVITAAHCLRLKGQSTNVPPNLLYVALGQHQLRSWREEAEYRYVLNYTIHPDYAYSDSADSDLAILVLSSPVEFNLVMKPICLWTGPIDLQAVVNKIGYIAGWRQDESGQITLEKPRRTMMPIVSLMDCLFSHQNFVSIVTNRTFCAGSRDGNGPCNGDGGTGLMLYDSTSNRYYLRGIASRSLLHRSIMSCDLNSYVVFVDVASYVDWIREQISAN